MDIIGGNNNNTNAVPGQGVPPQPPLPDQMSSAQPQSVMPAGTDTLNQEAQNLAQGSDTTSNMQPLPQTDVTAMQPDLEPKKGGKGKTALIVLGSLLVVAAAAGAGWYIGNTSGKSTGRAEGRQQALEEFQDEATPATDELTDPADEGAELTLGELKDAEYKDESLEAEVGEQVTTNDGLVLMVTNIERNYKTDDANYKLDDTKELVKVNFLMGNITRNKPKDLSSFSFRLENSKGAQLTPENLASYDGKFDTVKIDPGTQSKGSVVYAVNKNEKPLTFTRSQVYRITNQNREVTTKVSVQVAK